MSGCTRFRPYDLDQLLLLPQSLREWLPDDHLAHFIIDVVGEFPLTKIYRAYADGSQGGQPPYEPRMMVNLLLYAYCVGMPSSRKIEQATYDQVAFRFLSGDQHPDHDTISEFRHRHLKALAGLFTDVFELCKKAGLVKLGHVSLDSTKVKANASKHKAMSYGRMEKDVDDLQAEVDRLLALAEETDAAEDTQYGKGRRGDELPEDLRHKQPRLQKIRSAMKALEEEALAEYPEKQAEYEAKQKARKKRGGKGRPPKAPSHKPEAGRQRNFTDPDSRIQPVEGGKSFIQGYSCQAAVDDKAQIIVAADVTQDTNDKRQVAPMIERIKASTGGKKPRTFTADSGYFTEANVQTLEKQQIDAYIATEKLKHGERPPLCPRGRIPKDATVKERMTRKLRTVKGRCTYSKRKHIPEPVFGQIKEVRAFRQFSFRTLDKARDEWALVCLTHNILKLFRSGWAPNPA
jgi:transposase|tara:strand:- start:187 stop:1569 length:1383 start_codon:yes stop_codon:yes gene_type:complete